MLEAGGYYNCKKTDGICEDVCDSEVSGPLSRLPSFRHARPTVLHSDLSLSLPRRVFLWVWFLPRSTAIPVLDGDCCFCYLIAFRL